MDLIRKSVITTKRQDRRDRHWHKSGRQNTYRGSNRFKVETEGIGVGDIDIGNHVDCERGRAAHDLEIRCVLQTQVVNGRQLEHGDNDDRQHNDDQQQQETAAAGHTAAGRADAGETLEIL